MSDPVKNEEVEETKKVVEEEIKVGENVVEEKKDSKQDNQLEKYQKIEQISDIVVDDSKNWNFWASQPVPYTSRDNDKGDLHEGPLEFKKVDEIQKTPLKLPTGFEWVEVDLQDQKSAEEVYVLLTENYVEDEDNMFRFDYSIDFLRWTLNPPGFYKDWIVGVQVIKTKKLVGFITGVPIHLSIENRHRVKMAEINFLCVSKKLRAKRLAPVLIKEITRRVNVRDMWQAAYTAGVVVPTPIAKARYFHRSLNPKKLIEINFSSLGPNQTMARVIKLYKLPQQTSIEGLREMKKKDIAQVTVLLNKFLDRCKIYTKFTEEECKHFLLPRKEVVYSYVVENPESKKITDLISFYYLPSSIIKHEKYDKLRAAYSFYNVATSCTLTQLMENALIKAQENEFDVFNILDIMENESILKDLKFSPGDGYLHYYLYNWRLTKSLESKELGLVLV